jgi:hypothetical protein
MDETLNTTTEGQDTDIVMIGSHMGKQYKELLTDPQQCQWILMTAEQDPMASKETKRLARYLVKKEQQFMADGAWMEVETPPARLDEAL